MELQDKPIFQAASEEHTSRRPKSKISYDVYGVSPVEVVLSIIRRRNIIENHIIESRNI